MASFYYDTRSASSSSSSSSSAVAAPVLVNTLRSIALVDNSGSTYGRRLTDQLNLTKRFNAGSIVLWNSTAELLRSNERAVSHAGTSPSCLFTEPAIVELIHQGQFIVFSTDGEVDPTEIQRFSEQVSNHFSHCSLIIAVVVDESERPGRVNLSVFASLLGFPNLLILRIRDEVAHILMASDSLKTQLKESQHAIEVLDLTKTWQDLPVFNPTLILDWKVESRPDSFTPLRTGYRYLSNQFALSFAELFTIKDVLLVEEDWDFIKAQRVDICLLAKNENKIELLRNWLKEQESIMNHMILDMSEVPASVQDLQTKIVQVMERLYDQQRGDATLIHELRSLRLEYETAKNTFLEEARGQPRYQMIRTRLNDLQVFYSTLHGFEISTYSSADMNMNMNIGNRARRAAVVSEDLHRDLFDQALHTLTWNDAPQLECSICCDVNHGCLLLCEKDENESKEAIRLNGTDYSMNNPLACGRQNLCFVSPDCICIHCANCIYKQTGVAPLTRRKITGVLPVCSLATSANRRFFFKTLARGLGGGKELPHLGLLCFALLDVMLTQDWAQKELIVFLQREMLTHFHATTDFKETGRQVCLQEAMNAIVEDEFNLQRQPIETVSVILRHTTPLVPEYEQRRILKKRVLRLSIERYLTAIKPNCTQEEDHKNQVHVKRQLLSQLYECEETGMPRFQGGKIADNNAYIFIPSHLLRHIREDAKRLQLDDYLPSPMSLTRLYYHLLDLPYDPLEKVLNQQEFGQFLNSVEAVDDLYDNDLTRDLNNKMFHILPRSMNPAHPPLPVDQLPPYATIYGPSVLHCFCGHVFSNKQDRAEHFALLYGSSVPSGRSYHVNSHRMVADYIQEKFPLPTEKLLNDPRVTIPADFSIPQEPTREMVVQVLKRLYKKGIDAEHGNVFRPELPLEVAMLLRDYIRCMTVTKMMDLQPAPVYRVMSFEEKCQFKAKFGSRQLTFSATEKDRELSTGFTVEEIECMLPL